MQERDLTREKIVHILTSRANLADLRVSLKRIRRYLYSTPTRSADPTQSRLSAGEDPCRHRSDLDTPLYAHPEAGLEAVRTLACDASTAAEENSKEEDGERSTNFSAEELYSWRAVEEKEWWEYLTEQERADLFYATENLGHNKHTGFA